MSAQQIIVNVLGSKCSQCGSITKLQIHHKDKNREHNDLSNLELLCLQCHKTLHGKRAEPKKKTSLSIDDQLWREWVLYVVKKTGSSYKISEETALSLTEYMKNHPIER